MERIEVDQIMGLNPWAQEFVKGESVLDYVEDVTRIYSDGREERVEPNPVFKSLVRKEETGDYFGTKRGYPFYRYIFPDGKVYVEKAYMTLISPMGPIYLIALWDEKENGWVYHSLWVPMDITGLAQ